MPAYYIIPTKVGIKCCGYMLAWKPGYLEIQDILACMDGPMHIASYSIATAIAICSTIHRYSQNHAVTTDFVMK